MLKKYLQRKKPEPIENEVTPENEYILYAQEFEQTLCGLEASFHESDDPKDIALGALKTACRFYHADWAGIMLVDFDVNIWSPLWWYNINPADKTELLLKDLESSEYLHRWGTAMKENHAVIIPDTESMRVEFPKEYALYSRLKATSVLAVPFKPRPIGFLVVRNPKRYIQNSSMLQMLAYVVLTAMNERKMLESAKLVKHPQDIKSKKEFVIHTFGALEIHSATGVLHQEDLKSPRMCRLLIYLLLNPKTSHPPREIADAIWPEEEFDQDSICSNLRGLLYRFRQTFALISDQDLIISTSNGYRLNPDLKIMTDMTNFDCAWQAVQSASGTTRKVDLIKQAMAIYTGEMYPPASGELWMLSTANHYSLRYQGLVNELLVKLAEAQEWDAVCHYASAALRIIPENINAHFWLIFGMYKTGAVEMANSEISRAENSFTAEEYRELVQRLKKAKNENCYGHNDFHRHL